MPEPTLEHWWVNTTADVEGLEHMKSTAYAHRLLF